MKKLSLLPLLLAATLASATDTAYSPPVGGMTMPAAATTDSFVSAALSRPAAWVGAAASVTGNDITVSGSPAWSTNIYAPGTYHYVRIQAAPKPGNVSTLSVTVPAM